MAQMATASAAMHLGPPPAVRIFGLIASIAGFVEAGPPTLGVAYPPFRRRARRAADLSADCARRQATLTTCAFADRQTQRTSPLSKKAQTFACRPLQP